MRQNEQIDIWITRFLQGEASSTQIEDLKIWLAESEENEAYFQNFEDAYFLSAQTERSFDESSAWRKISENLNDSKVRSLHWRSWRTWAAAIAVAMLGTWVWMATRPTHVLELASAGQVIKQELPNGTTLTLNANSTMVYDENEKSTWVEMEGDAYFEVAHRDAKLFYVKTNDVIIKDIGTSFHVHSVLNEDTVFFHVDDGTIVCYGAHHDSLLLTMGQSGYYCRSNSTFGLRTHGDFRNAGAFATGRLVYDEVRMEQVVADIQNLYHVKIQMADLAMLDCTISVTFDHQDITEIADILAITMGWQVQCMDGIWYFSGPPCQTPF